MPHYRQVGDVPPKRHTQFRSPDGDLYAEELMGSDGFSSASSLLYHRRPPTALVAADAVDRGDDELRPNEPLLPHHLRTAELPEGDDLVAGRRLLLANDDVRLLVAQADRAQRPLPQRRRRRDRLPARRERPGWSRRSGRSTAGPATTSSCPPAPPTAGCPTADEPVAALVIEARGHVGPPDRYLSAERPVPRAQPLLRARPARARDAPLVVDDAAAGDGGGSTCSCASGAGSPATATPTTPSTSSAGTAACTRTGCRSTTSSR